MPIDSDPLPPGPWAWRKLEEDDAEVSLIDGNGKEILGFTNWEGWAFRYLMKDGERELLKRAFAAVPALVNALVNIRASIDAVDGTSQLSTDEIDAALALVFPTKKDTTT